MGPGIDGFDHPVIAVRDMEEARARYRRLGFTIPPLGRHREWGTGNWCIMFADDYLELRGIVDAARPTHNLDAFLAEREGLMGIAFAPEVDAGEAHRRLAAAGLAPASRQLTRNFLLPEGTVQPRFALCFWNADGVPGLAGALVCQHLTPELIRRPAWLRHPNGVTRVTAVTSVVESIDDALPAYRRIFGDDAVTGGADGARVDVGKGDFLRLCTAAGLARRYPNVAFDPPPAVPYQAAVTLAVADLDATKKLLAGNGIALATTPSGSIVASPADTCGVVLEFAAAD